MRRPEIASFIAVAPPANVYDFTFLAPCPSSGLILQGDQDTVVPLDSVQKLVTKLSHQRDIKIDFRKIAGADHYFVDRLDTIAGHADNYIRAHARLGARPPAAAHGRPLR
jgi:alpha/beta superfamily hydrolase